VIHALASSLTSEITAWTTAAGVIGGFITLGLSYREIRRGINIRLAERAEHLVTTLIEIERIAVERPHLAPYLQSGKALPAQGDPLRDEVIAYALLFTDFGEMVGWQLKTDQMRDEEAALAWHGYLSDLRRTTPAIRHVLARDGWMLAGETRWLFGAGRVTKAVSDLGIEETFELRSLRDAAPDPELLEAVHRDLFLPSFPDPDEREEPADWIPRLWGGAPPPAPEQHAVVAGTHFKDRSRRSLAGFAFVERYRSSRSGLLSYIAVDASWRRQGLAQALFDAGLESARKAAHDDGEPLKAVFAEIHDPRRVENTADVIDPAERANIMERLGGWLVPIDYVQPALSTQSERSDRLLLIAFPQHGEQTLDASTVRGFLIEFFSALGVSEPDIDPDLARMSAELGEGAVELAPLTAAMEWADRHRPHARELA
jgi:GNAT superfamily N-acetyltransferase